MTFSELAYVTLKDGSTKQIKDIHEHTEIVCGFCKPEDRADPTSTNAFIDLNNFGSYYQGCSSEADAQHECLTRYQSIEETSEKLVRKGVYYDLYLAAPIIIYNIDEMEDVDPLYNIFNKKDQWKKFAIDNNINPYQSAKTLPIIRSLPAPCVFVLQI